MSVYCIVLLTSLEDIAIGTHPSPAHGRTAFLAGDEVEVEPQVS